jgi:hypothetical protein
MRFVVKRKEAGIHRKLVTALTQIGPVQANFFTLSSFGVTHFINGKPEFSELEQWKREVRPKQWIAAHMLNLGIRIEHERALTFGRLCMQHYLFNAIVKIPVFRQYRTWKTYKVWRDSVRYGKMVRSRMGFLSV